MGKYKSRYQLRYAAVGIPLVVTIVALLGFAVFAFLGLNYMLEGYTLSWLPERVPRFALSGGVILLLTLIEFVCLRMMCRGKADRSRRRGVRREIVWGILALVILMGESIPFTKFVNIVDYREQILKDVKIFHRKVASLDSLYHSYVDRRVESYRVACRRHGESHATSMAKSLRRRLEPPSMKAIEEKRKVWLSSFDSISIWNIATPHNVTFEIKIAEVWTAEYANVSAFTYRYEEEGDPSVYAPFSRYWDEEQLLDWKDCASGWEGVDIRVLTILLALVALMQTSYACVQRRKNRK